MKEYFPHAMNARSDERILPLRIKHGWAGYGLYWAIIEKLRDSMCYSLKCDYNALSFDLRVDTSFIKSVINDFGLFAFTENGECFHSEWLDVDMKPLDEKRKKLSDAGRRGSTKRWGEKPEGTQENSHPNSHPIKKTSPPYNNSIAKGGTPQAKIIARRVEYSKEEKEDNTSSSVHTQGENSSFGNAVDIPLDKCKDELMNDALWLESVCMGIHSAGYPEFKAEYLDKHFEEFFGTLGGQGLSVKSVRDAKSHFFNWLKGELKQAKNKKNRNEFPKNKPDPKTSGSGDKPNYGGKF